MPTNHEVMVGIGLAMGLDLLVIVPLFEKYITNEGLLGVMFGSSALGILFAMKVRDRAHRNLVASERMAKVEPYCGIREMVKVSCPCEIPCTGELRLMPPQEESIVYICPKCDTTVSVGRISSGEVIAYAAKIAKVIR